MWRPRSKNFDWSWAPTRHDCRKGGAPTRDEAMALALGWERVFNWWEFDAPHGFNGLCHTVFDDGEVFRVLPCGSAGRRAGFPSLPHAIAWARGEADHG